MTTLEISSVTAHEISNTVPITRKHYVITCNSHPMYVMVAVKMLIAVMEKFIIVVGLPIKNTGKSLLGVVMDLILLMRKYH